LGSKFSGKAGDSLKQMKNSRYKKVFRQTAVMFKPSCVAMTATSCYPRPKHNSKRGFSFSVTAYLSIKIHNCFCIIIGQFYPAGQIHTVYRDFAIWTNLFKLDKHCPLPGLCKNKK